MSIGFVLNIISAMFFDLDVFIVHLHNNVGRETVTLKVSESHLTGPFQGEPMIPLVLL